MEHVTTMKIRPTSNWKLLGTEAELDTNTEYDAVWATNQPNWREERKIFVDHPAAPGFLLSRGDYVITDPDPPAPVTPADIRHILRSWLLAVDIPDNGPENGDGEEGQLTLTDNAMLQLIDRTKKFVATCSD